MAFWCKGAQFPFPVEVMEVNDNGARVSQDDSGTANPPSSLEDVVAANKALSGEADDEYSAQNVFDADDQTASESDDPAAPDAESSDESDLSEEELDEVSKLLEESKTSDHELVKKLRGFLKNAKKESSELSEKVATLEAATSQEVSLDPEELVKGLVSFNLETGQPTTEPFARSLYEKDVGLTQRLFEDLALLKDDNGWTLAHHFLKREGIDPTRLDDVRAFLKGEIEAKDISGIVPEHVPQEYREAYQSLSKIDQEDLLFQLDPEQDGRPESRNAALQRLRDRQYVIDNQKAAAAQQAQQREAQQQQLWNETVKESTNTYRAIFEGLEKSSAFQKAKISSNPTLDAVAKNSFLTQLNALGDPNTLLSTRAAEFFKANGVEIDYGQVESLIGELESALQTKVIAAHQGHQMHVTQANHIIQTNMAKMVALGVKYFVEYTKNLNKSQKELAEQEGAAFASNAGIPTLDGAPNTGGGGKSKLSANQELERLMQTVAAANRKQS